MKRRECKLATPSTDLLVCFPSRAHLSLHKAICSPARPSEPIKHHHNKSFRRGNGRSGGGGGQVSPLIWAKNKQMGSEMNISEPTSPKVTCAGQIKVRPRTRPGTCKNWQSVMEEIEKLHNERKQKRPSWVEAIGIKKDAMQFLNCLRNIRFDFRCFGAFPTSHITSDDEDDNNDQEDEEEEDEEVSKTVFSKWFMVLQENQENGLVNKDSSTTSTNTISQEEKENYYKHDDDNDDDDNEPRVPPSNALMLMRCRSAPAKSWLEEIEESRVEEERKEKEKLIEEELEKKRKKNMVVMRFYEDDDLYKISSDIAKETWVVDGIKDQLSRSRSCKR